MRKYISIMILIALCGCGMKKETNRLHIAEVKKDIRWTDSLKREQIVVGLGNRKLKIHHIEWLPPDSSGQQFVKSVTGMVTEEEQKITTNTVETLQSQKDTSQKMNIRTVEKSKSKPRDYVVSWGVMMILTILFILIYKRWKK